MLNVVSNHEMDMSQVQLVKKQCVYEVTVQDLRHLL